MCQPPTNQLLFLLAWSPCLLSSVPGTFRIIIFCYWWSIDRSSTATSRLELKHTGNLVLHPSWMPLLKKASHPPETQDANATSRKGSLRCPPRYQQSHCSSDIPAQTSLFFHFRRVPFVSLQPEERFSQNWRIQARTNHEPTWLDSNYWSGTPAAQHKTVTSTTSQLKPTDEMLSYLKHSQERMQDFRQLGTKSLKQLRFYKRSILEEEEMSARENQARRGVY